MKCDNCGNPTRRVDLVSRGGNRVCLHCLGELRTLANRQAESLRREVNGATEPVSSSGDRAQAPPKPVAGHGSASRGDGSEA